LARILGGVHGGDGGGFFGGAIKALANACNNGAVCGLSSSYLPMVSAEFLACRGVRPKSNKATISIGCSRRTASRAKLIALAPLLEILLSLITQIECQLLTILKISQISLAIAQPRRLFSGFGLQRGKRYRVFADLDPQ